MQVRAADIGPVLVIIRRIQHTHNTLQPSVVSLSTDIHFGPVNVDPVLKNIPRPFVCLPTVLAIWL